MALSILHVDDDECIQDVAKLALETLGGFNVVSCSSGIEALDVAPDLKPDIILLDLMMPDMDGIETFEKLQANPETQNIPVVFVTASSDAEEITDLNSKMVLGYVAKPFDPMELATQIRSFINA